ncbi:BaiN/RdsA family NAD(P)/FAD-dependent oxidoreductase [Prevotella dentasini]
MSHSPHIAVIGGGAAGFFAAITAKTVNPQARVAIYEKAGKVLAKVGISGGGRCNLTNSFEEIKDLKNAYPRGHKLIKRLFKSFDHRDTYRWFETHGVALTTQDDQCVFPVSQDSQSVIDCLTREAHKRGVRVLLHHSIQSVEKETDGKLLVHFKGREPLSFDKVIITTGGSPKADGLSYLKKLGIQTIAPVPSLFTFTIKEPLFCDLMGTVAENAILSIPSTKFHSSGPLLITHWGISGPATLKLSSLAARYISEQDYRFPLAVNWVGNSNAQAVAEHLQVIIAAHPQKQLGSIRPFDLPTRLWLYLLQKNGINNTKRWSELGRKGFNKLTETLTNDQYTVNGKGTFRDEFVTCGGVSLSCLTPALESKACPNLFFAGEVLDVDAITGGFNLQAAWTTGYMVGKTSAKGEQPLS